jgi:hypothetical protein
MGYVDVVGISLVAAFSHLKHPSAMALSEVQTDLSTDPRTQSNISRFLCQWVIDLCPSAGEAVCVEDLNVFDCPDNFKQAWANGASWPPKTRLPALRFQEQCHSLEHILPTPIFSDSPLKAGFERLDRINAPYMRCYCMLTR